MRCPNCNTLWPEELAGMLKFCGACGASLKASPAATLLSTVSDPGGELRFVTVLFADLVGFTSYAEERSPDEVAQVVGGLLQCLGQVVEACSGVVYQFLGDAVVATFGLPRPDPNAARNAVRAGLAMQETVRQFNAQAHDTFRLRIGIHAGEVMFRSLGGSWTMMGDTMNTASRIQSAAPPGRVWISRSVYEEVRRFFTLLVRPAVELKGKKLAIQPYEVIGERVIPLVDLSCFVGRDREWAQIQAALQDAVEKRTLKVVLIRGAAGVGKSRMIAELRDWVQRNPVVYRVDVAQFDHSERLPSHGLNTLIRSRFNLPLHLSDAEILARLQEEMSQENPAVEAERAALAAEFFAFALGILRPEFRISSMDGKGKWEGTFLEIKSWLESRSRQSPWLWILEDAQKGDADTAAFLDWAFGMPWNAPLLVVITLREEDFDPESYWYEPIGRWLKNDALLEIRLREIQPEILARALTSMADGAISEAVALRIAEHTEGNPLFATELILFLREQGLAEHELSLENIRLPGSIREVMEARLEHLGTDGKEVAKRGALMGRRFTREAVERIWDQPPLELDKGLHVLRETETVFDEVSQLFSGEIEHVFRHGRLQEAAHARIPREERLRWLDGLEAWARAKLASLGDAWEGAGVLLVPLVARSLEEHGEVQQASLWQEVLGLLHCKYHRTKEALPSLYEALQAASGVRRLVLARQIAEVEIFNGEIEKALQTLESAGPQADPPAVQFPAEVYPQLATLVEDPLLCWWELSLPEVLFSLELTRAHALTQLGRISEAQAKYRQLEGALDSLTGVTGQRLWLRWAQFWIYLLGELVGDYNAAEAICQKVRRGIALDAPALAAERLGFVNSEFLVEMRLGHYNQAAAINAEQLRLAQAMNNAREEARTWNGRGIITQSLGDLPQAAEAYGKAIHLSRAIGYRRGEVISLHNLSGVNADLGRYDEAQQQEEQYLAISRVTGNRLAEAYAPNSLGAIALGRRDYEAAETWVRQSLQIAEANGWPVLVGINQISLGEIRLCRWLERHDALLLQEAVHYLKAAEPSVQGEQSGEFFTGLSPKLISSTLPTRTNTTKSSACFPASGKAKTRGTYCPRYASYSVGSLWLCVSKPQPRQPSANAVGSPPPHCPFGGLLERSGG